IFSGKERPVFQTSVHHAVKPVDLVVVAFDRVVKRLACIMLEVVQLAGHRAKSAHLPKQPLIDLDACALIRRIEFSGLATEILQDRTGLEDGYWATAWTLRIHDRGHAVVRGDLQKIRIELVALRNVHRLQDIWQTALFEHDRYFETVRRRPVIKLNRL